MSTSLRDKIVGLLAMSRPKPLAALLMAWALGCSAAYGSGVYSFNGLMISFLSMVFAGGSAHYANEYADSETDSLALRTHYSGGSGVIPSGIVPRSWALWMATVTLVIGEVICFVGVNLGVLSFESFLVYTAGMFGGWMYSLPPLKFAWRGLGEAANAILGAWMTPIFGYMSISLSIDTWVLISFFPFTFATFLNLLAVTWPDKVNDAKVGKYTLATRWEPEKLRSLYFFGLILMYGILLLTMIRIPFLVSTAGFFAFPFSIYGYITYTRHYVSPEIVYAMVVMALSQISVWMLIGSGLL